MFEHAGLLSSLILLVLIVVDFPIPRKSNSRLAEAHRGREVSFRCLPPGPSHNVTEGPLNSGLLLNFQPRDSRYFLVVSL